MNWKSLPWMVVENIVYQTAEEADYLETTDANRWLMHIRKCAAVCNEWKEIIFNSKELFRVYEEAAIHFGEDGDGLDHEGYERDKTNETGELLVREGYMRLAASLKLFGDHQPSARWLELLLDHAEGNTIDFFDVNAMEWNAEDFNKLVRLLTMSKPSYIEITYDLNNQNCAHLIWSFLIDTIKSPGENIELLKLDFHGSDFEDINRRFIADHAVTNNLTGPVRSINVQISFYDIVRFDATTSPSEMCFIYNDVCAETYPDFVRQCQGIVRQQLLLLMTLS